MAFLLKLYCLRNDDIKKGSDEKADRDEDGMPPDSTELLLQARTKVMGGRNAEDRI